MQADCDTSERGTLRDIDGGPNIQCPVGPGVSKADDTNG